MRLLCEPFLSRPDQVCFIDADSFHPAMDLPGERFYQTTLAVVRLVLADALPGFGDDTVVFVAKDAPRKLLRAIYSQYMPSSSPGMMMTNEPVFELLDVVDEPKRCGLCHQETNRYNGVIYERNGGVTMVGPCCHDRIPSD